MDKYLLEEQKALWNVFCQSVLERNPKQFQDFHNYFESKYNSLSDSDDNIEENVA